MHYTWNTFREEHRVFIDFILNMSHLSPTRKKQNRRTFPKGQIWLEVLQGL